MKQLMLLMAIFLMTACTANKETADTNQQPEHTEHRSRKGGQKQPPSVDELMAKMDANKDGKLAKSEVKGRLLEDFSKVDTNDDGFLSKAELEKAPKPQKGGNGQKPPRQ